MDKPEKNYNEQFLEPSNSIIDNKIYRFLLTLMGNIFLNPKNPQEYQKIIEYLDFWLKEINTKLIKDKNKSISTEYSIDNFKKIIDFVKFQNKVLAGDILEGILILIFSYACKINKENTFGEFIYKMSKENSDNSPKYKLEESDNYDLAKWFKKNKFIPNELLNIEELLKNDNLVEKDEKQKNNILKDSPLYYLLFQIQKLKYLKIKIKNENYNRDKYIYRRNFKYNQIIDNNFSSNFIPQKIIRHFFISVFIYYQNKHSPLMKYIKEENKKIKIEYEDEDNDGQNSVEEEEIFLAGIPFNYNLSEAALQNRFANTVMSPSRIEPRINKLTFSQNKLDERGIYELAKVLIFNKYVKKCSLDTSFIKSYYLDYLNLGFGIYDNYTLEELNLNINNINKECGEYLCNILSHLKNLKTINLSSNEIKKGASVFFVMLKRLYRSKQTNLENLIINKCNLDNSSFYELGELLKSKYCNLKRLYLNNNIIPANSNFLKKLKKNKNLTQIYLNKNNLNETNTDDIMRLISNTQIETLYLFKNKIAQFSHCLRILYRTKLIRFHRESDNSLQPSFLINLDISDNYCFDKNAFKIELLDQLIKKTTLYSLDLSHILYDNNTPDKIIKKEENREYTQKIDELSKYLDSERDKYAQELDEQNCLKVDIEEDEERIIEYKKQILEDKDFDEDKIKLLIDSINTNIAKDERAKFPLFLREESKKIIREIVNNEFSEKDFGTFLKEKLIIKEDQKDTVNFQLYKKIENFLLYNMSKLNKIFTKKQFKNEYKMIII